MMTMPPPLPPIPPLTSEDTESKRRRTAILLNLALPGAGQFYLGRKGTGVGIMGLFLFSFVVVVGMMLWGFFLYFRGAVDADILAPGHLENLAEVFKLRWIFAGLAVAILLVAFSIADLYWSRPANRPPP